MLKTLRIRDLAIIDRIELGFVRGLTVITGETGAGKSILLDGLSLIAGVRADAATVRNGADRAEVEAEFSIADLAEVQAWLAQESLDEDGECLIRRVVRADGGSRAFINGRAVTLVQARALAAMLIEMHGQHEHQRLLDRSHQMVLLDRFGAHEPLLLRVAERATTLRQLRADYAALRAEAGGGAEILALYETQRKELADANMSADKLATLDIEQRRLSHAESLGATYGQGATLLEGDGQRGGVLKQLLSLQHDLHKMANIDPELGTLAGRVETCRIELDDVARELQRLADDVDLDPAQLRAVETQLARAHELARKHRIGVESLPDKLAELTQRVTALSDVDTRLDQLDAQITVAAQAYDLAAQALSAARSKAARKLDRAVSDLMHELGMKGGQFVIALTQRDDGETPAQGIDLAEMMVSANAGQPPRPLRKVASGGEIARISLAIKVATLDLVDTPTLIFDEVDSGIGGPTAEIVGRKLRALAATRQVFNITHLPQVAACGHQHLMVHKLSKAGSTRSAVTALEGDARVEEIARMLGGLQRTDATVAAAREMMELAQRE